MLAAIHVYAPPLSALILVSFRAGPKLTTSSLYNQVYELLGPPREVHDRVVLSPRKYVSMSHAMLTEDNGDTVELMWNVSVYRLIPGISYE